MRPASPVEPKLCERDKQHDVYRPPARVPCIRRADETDNNPLLENEREL